MKRSGEEHETDDPLGSSLPSTLAQLRERLAEVEARMENVDRGLSAHADAERDAQVSLAVARADEVALEQEQRQGVYWAGAGLAVACLVLLALGLVFFARTSNGESPTRLESHHVSESFEPLPSALPLQSELTVGAKPAGPALMAPPTPPSIPRSKHTSQVKHPEVLSESDETLRQALTTLRPDPKGLLVGSDESAVLSDALLTEMVLGELSETGGLYLGQGGLEHQVLAGRLRSEVVVILSPNLGLKHLHRALGISLAASRNVEELLTLWKPDSRERLNAALVTALGDSLEATDVIGAVAEHPGVGRWIEALASAHRQAATPSIFTEPSQFEHLASLWRRGHAVVLEGSVFGNTTVEDLATFSAVLKRPLRTLALSRVGHPSVEALKRLSENLSEHVQSEHAVALWPLERAGAELWPVSQPLSAFKGCVDAAAETGWSSTIRAASKDSSANEPFLSFRCP